MKKIILNIFLILFSVSLFSQEEVIPVETYIKNLSTNNYAFEGVIESIEFYAGDKQGNKLPNSSLIWENGSGYFHNTDGSDARGYSLAKIKLYKTYKGTDLSNQDYLYILTSTEGLQVYYTQMGKDTILNQMNFNNPHDNSFVIMPAMKNYRIIFFGNKNAKGQFTIKDNNSVIYYNSTYNPNAESSSNPNKQEFASLNFKRFYSEIELKDFLTSIGGINVNAKANYNLEKKSAVQTEKKIENIKPINYEVNLKNYNTWLKNNKPREKSTNNKSSNTLANDLNLQIANPRIVGAVATPSLEFDILASANTGSTYFDNCLIRIMYNTTAFGSSVVANSNISVTRATPYNTLTYIDPQINVIDQTNNTIGLPFGTEFSAGSWNRPSLPTTPTLLLTVKIKIQSCSQFANINFTDVNFTDLFSRFALTATAHPSVAVGYDNTYYTGTITDKTCEPKITSFNNNVPAGVNQVLTITGKYFGNSKASGTVIFKNADKGTTYPPQVGPYKSGVQQYDVIRWTHDTIKIKMPGTIDSTIADKVVPGSGKFQVYNKYNSSTESTTPIIIDYAVTQFPDGGLTYPYRKVGLKLAGLNGGNGYKVQINQNIITGIPNSKPAIKKAMRAWTCATGVNWFLGNDTTVGIGVNSNLCIVDTGNFSALMKTLPTVRSCTTISGVPVFYLKSFNIKIKLSPNLGPWNTDTASAIPSGQYDFYSGISHEFGHAHGVAHINDSLVDLMWWQGYSTGYTALGRKLVKYSPGAVSAGNYVSDSLVGGLTCATNHFTVLAQNCEDAIGVKKNYGDLFNITVSPNPSSTNEGLNIKFNLTQQQNINIALYDITGKLISTSNLVGIKDDEYLFSNNNLEAGIYLLQISIGIKKQSYKIVKQ